MSNSTMLIKLPWTFSAPGGVRFMFSYPPMSPASACSCLIGSHRPNMLAGVPWPLWYNIHFDFTDTGKRRRKFLTHTENQQLTWNYVHIIYIYICYSNLLVCILVSGIVLIVLPFRRQFTSPRRDRPIIHCHGSRCQQTFTWTAGFYVFWHGYFLHVKFLALHKVDIWAKALF